MGDLFWPGDERADEIFAQRAFLRAMVRVEQAWLSALCAAGVAPARQDLTVLLADGDVAAVSRGAESAGNPVLPLLDLLRSRVDSPEVASWLHRGLTSQDVVDTALMLCAREAVARIHSEVDQQSTALAGLADTHRRTLMAGRTLTQHAVPITSRTAVTRVGDACTTATDAFGRIAIDVLIMSRPEIGELREATGGGSSTMPHKANPILSVLVRRAALAAPALAAQLHLASAESVDERSDGAWHVEWSTLATVARRAVVAASQTTEVLAGLRVDADRMAATAHDAAADLLAEPRSLGGDLHDPASYLGANDRIIDAVLDRHRETR